MVVQLKPVAGTDDVYLWKYLPSIPAAVIFVILFSVVMAAHLWRMVRTRTWFCSAFAVGGICMFFKFRFSTSRFFFLRPCFSFSFSSKSNPLTSKTCFFSSPSHRLPRPGIFVLSHRRYCSIHDPDLFDPPRARLVFRVHLHGVEPADPLRFRW